MTFGEFLSDRFLRIMIQLLCVGLAALFLWTTGTQPGILVILILVLLLVFLAVQLSDFFRQRARLRELEAVLNSLDQKYLFPECVPPPRGLYERKLFDLTRRAGRAMTGAVSDAQAAQREYREYVEQWGHEVKAPITAARLICRELDGTTRRKLTGELARVFDNLLRNACHYSTTGTEVHVAARQGEDGLTLTFTNTGATIPPEKLSRIFEQFFRLDSSRASGTGGAGLGLAIAREIIQLHGGTISAQSEKGITTLTVCLPNL